MADAPFPQQLVDQLAATGLVAVLTIDDAQHAVPLAQALMEGGVTVMELTLRTPAALDALRAIRREVPDMVAGMGTVLTTHQVIEVREAGAVFGVSPGTNVAVVQAAQSAGLPFAPGIVTPTDVETALDLGCRTLKFFPSEPSGGLPYLRTMAAPYAHLGVRYVPLGGVSPANLRDYLSDDLVLAVGGSWLAPRDLVSRGDWDAIRQRALEAREIAAAVI